ncbi:MAG TPA: hypothetical protein VJS12_07705 [Steroidobacteraceae bacterium]|nr:hypothetical protein [Steroidobacteraceae bacterium]
MKTALRGILIACLMHSTVVLAEVELPAMNYYSSIASDELFAAIKAHPAFVKLDKELYGSALSVRVTHSLQPTAAGKATGFFSAILTGGTLGLIPAVSNNNFALIYEVKVHGKTAATFTYQKTFTRAFNIWSKDETHGLGKDGLEWAQSTATQFAADAASDPRVLELKREHDLYFPVAAAAN